MEGGVYLSETVEDALQFMYIRNQPGKFAVIPVYLDESDTLEPGEDHDPDAIQATSYFHPGAIPAEKVERKLSNIPLFGFR